MQNLTSRLEAFCDGVFAIAITLLIIEIKVPAHDTITSTHTLFMALLEHWPSWFSFLLSFGTIFIAWANHHNSFRLVNKTSTLFNFANGFFLLTIAILPYPTALLAEYITTDSAKTAIMFYCSIIMLQNISWTLLFQSMIKPKDLSKNPSAKKNDIKNPPAVHLWIHSLPDDQHPGFLVSACCDWFNGRVMVCLDISRDFHSR